MSTGSDIIGKDPSQCVLNNFSGTSELWFILEHWTLSKKNSAQKFPHIKMEYLEVGNEILQFNWFPTSRTEVKMDKGLVRLSDIHTHTHIHSFRLAAFCRVMRGVMCEGGVGEKSTEGLREIESEIERCRGSWVGCVFWNRDCGKSFFFFFDFTFFFKLT